MRAPDVRKRGLYADIPPVALKHRRLRFAVFAVGGTGRDVAAGQHRHGFVLVGNCAKGSNIRNKILFVCIVAVRVVR